jgi:hypothetical protein
MAWYWPDVSTVESAESAAHLGAGVCFFVAGLTGLIAAISTFSGKPIVGLTTWSFVDAALFAFAGWRVWKLSRTWAAIALVLYIAERIDRLAYTRTTSGVVMAVIFTLALLSGVRGTFAHHRLTAAQGEAARAAGAGREGN